jgi:thioredoxin 1
MNSPNEPSRAEIDALTEPTLIEFGAAHCGHCRAAQPLIADALARHPQLRHIKVEDGPGRPLGRSFRVKLWPTLVVLSEGREVARLVRPADPVAIEQALAQLGAVPLP